jgi:hypothetical protein
MTCYFLIKTVMSANGTQQPVSVLACLLRANIGRAPHTSERCVLLADKLRLHITVFTGTTFVGAVYLTQMPSVLI